MEALNAAFNERVSEIKAYLDLLSNLERQVQSGPPTIADAKGGVSTFVITPEQQKILYSSVYLQLYNLVEATITLCIEAVASAAAKDGAWQPRDLSHAMRREWVRVTARTHFDLDYENRLSAAVDLCDRMIDALPIEPFVIAKGGGGNWDDRQIESFTKRLGLSLRFDAAMRESIKRPIRDGKGALALIVSIRNDLAHGSLSFVECGEEVTSGDLYTLQEKTVAYLREVLAQFASFIVQHEFLLPECRPA